MNIEKHNSALEELAKNMGWSISDAHYFWEGGAHDPKRQERLDQDLKNKGLVGDSDDFVGFAQFLYDCQILSPASLETLQLTGYVTWTYLCVWGNGYVVSEPYKAHMEERTREQLLDDESFEGYESSINNMFLGGSIQICGCGDVMSLVRIK